MSLQQLLGKSQSLIIGLDLDGTLINSSERHINLLKDLLIKYSISLNVDDYMEQKSKGQSTKDFLINHGVDEKRSKLICDEWISRIESSEYLKLDTILVDTKPFLKHISKKNTLILITARKNKQGAIAQIKSFEIDHFFSEVHIVNPKYAKEEKVNVIRTRNIDCMIGDTEVDLQASISNDIPFIHIKSIFRTENFLRNINPNFLSFNSVLDLV